MIFCVGGSYATLVSPDNQHFSIIIETMNANNSQCVRCNPSWTWSVSTQTITFKLAGELDSNKKIHVWQSQLTGANPYYFEKQKDITPVVRRKEKIDGNYFLGWTIHCHYST